MQAANALKQKRLRDQQKKVPFTVPDLSKVGKVTSYLGYSTIPSTVVEEVHHVQDKHYDGHHEPCAINQTMNKTINKIMNKTMNGTMNLKLGLDPIDHPV